MEAMEMTKFNLKTLAVAVALAAAGSQANAAIINAQSGNSELMLYAWSDSLNRSYSRDLGIQMNDFLSSSTQGVATGGTVAPLGSSNGGSLAFDPNAAVAISAGNVTTSGYSLNFLADPLMLSWMGNGTTLASDIKWGIAASDGTGTGTAIRALSTCATAGCESVIEGGSNSSLNNYELPFDLYSGVHSLMGSHATGLNGSAGGVNDGTGQDAKATMRENWQGYANFTAVTGVGQSMEFYWISPSSGIATGKPRADRYQNSLGQSATWTLNANGSLSYAVPGAVVPVPAAVWLFGSGLVGLVGIARRKKSA
jgi:hypothetical protein